MSAGSSLRHVRRVACVAGLGAACSLPLAGQARRAPLVQHVARIDRGDLLFGLGLGHEWGGRYPLAGFEGDLWSLAEVTVVYGIGDRASLSVRGSSWRILSIETEASPSVPLDPGTADGTTADAGDFEIALAFAPFGGPTGFSAGALVEVKLPNTDETKGIGPNTTDVTLAALGSWGRGRWRATWVLGVAIMEAPLESFEQNDVLVYRLEGLFQATRRVRVSLGLGGHASTRDRVAIGTEDRGQVRLGLEVGSGAVVLDTGIGRGYAGNTADWGWSAGIAWLPGRSGRNR